MFSYSLFRLEHYLLVICLFLAFPAQAQLSSGNEAESGFQQSLPLQSPEEFESFPANRAWENSVPTQQNLAPKKLGKAIQKLQSRPQRPVPIVLMVLGFFLMAIWALLLIVTLLAADLAAFLLLLILTIVLSPIAILGLLLLIGGIIGQSV